MGPRRANAASSRPARMRADRCGRGAGRRGWRVPGGGPLRSLRRSRGGELGNARAGRSRRGACAPVLHCVTGSVGAGIEPATHGSGIRCSTRLSYPAVGGPESNRRPRVYSACSHLAELPPSRKAPARSSAYAAAGPRRTGRDSRARTAAKRQVCLAHCRHSHGGNSLRPPPAARAEAPRHSALAPAAFGLLPSAALAHPAHRVARTPPARRRARPVLRGSSRGIAPVRVHARVLRGAMDIANYSIRSFGEREKKRPRGGTRGRSRGLGEIGVTDLPGRKVSRWGCRRRAGRRTDNRRASCTRPRHA